MVDFLLTIAKKRSIRKIVAYVLPGNNKMIAVFKKMQITPQIIDTADQTKVVFDLTDDFSFSMKDFM